MFDMHSNASINAKKKNPFYYMMQHKDHGTFFFLFSFWVQMQ
jgi:hypothetical protein